MSNLALVTASALPVFGFHQREWLAPFALEEAAVGPEMAKKIGLHPAAHVRI
jgi:hypothetical protein